MGDELADLRERVERVEALVAGLAEARQELTVERINVVESDGAVRLVISNRTRAPDPVVGGKAGKRSGGNQAGLIFYNDEGDECGGIVYWGRSQDGRHGQGGAVLFDQYRQDQVCGIIHENFDGVGHAGLHVWDRPDQFLDDVVEEHQAVLDLDDGPEKRAALENLRQQGTFGRARLFAGKTRDAEAVVELRDAEGRVRLRLAVRPQGDAAVEFLDEAGQVTNRVTSS